MKINKNKREEIKKKYGGRCAYCGEYLTKNWQVDHFKPLRRQPDGGCLYPENHNDDNLMPSCASCNRDKSVYSIEQWRLMLYNKINLLNTNSSPYKILKRFGVIVENDNPIVFYYEKYNEEID